MKILHTVEFYSPSVGGSQEVAKQLSEHLVMLGHDVTVATTKLPHRQENVINGVKLKEFDIYGNKVRGIGGEADKYKQFLVKSKFDVIMNYAAQQWASELFADVIDRVHGKKVFVPCGFSALYDPAYKKYFQSMPDILKKYDATVYLSDDYRDINFARKHMVHNIHLIPNGADEREFGSLNKKDATKFRSKHGIANDELLILHVSTHTGVKGHREAIKAFQKANIKNATLMLVGDYNIKDNGCLKECLRSSWLNNHITKIWQGKQKNIQVVHISRKETIKAFQAADIFLFLSNIECSPLVLFEAAASGTPFITSKCGNAKEIAKWTGAGIVTKSTQDKYGFTQTDVNSAAKAIEMLGNDLELRQKMGRHGRKTWEKKYTWEHLAGSYEKIYINLLKQK